MTAEPTAAAKAAPAPSPQSPPRQQPPAANEQAIRRFKALVEREPAAADADPRAIAEQPMPRGPLADKLADLSEQGGQPFGETARPLAAPTPEAAPARASASAADRIAELQKASELALGLDRAHARPTATQLLLNGDAVIAGGTITQSSAPGAIDIAIQPGALLLTADSLDALRRRLAARGLTIGHLRLAGSDEDEGATP